MKQLTIPNTDLKSTPLVLGTDILSDVCKQDTYESILDTYTAADGTHMDTAALYAQGHSEECIGAWLKKSIRTLRLRKKPKAL